ncbi:YhcH/YjgK/YiaL family protein [Consotaella salsifontis]|uniref:YhcH/YjgK/YiaL family protein n=1 Tax=Consotaella salsifontis TaxID=1365950 RepID=A0A1T4RL12_9HYPH|nr:YhcH/YjgK/YiaL family protein [Consotaella salsifontis]SKA16587.1 YhcH/YjgK/YiaL family protein [Consotaella salsifontis]
MIFGRLENFENEASTLPEAILKGLRFLASTDLAAIEPGRVEIDGEAMFASFQQYETGAKATKKPEAHFRYIDIQYVVSGEEKIGFAPLSLVPAASEVIEDKDVQFFADVPNETDLVLTAGCYAVFYPWDVHRPACQTEAPSPVRKVVMKIRAS